jgi:hypothetical protein
MARHTASADDQAFARAFEACAIPPGEFDHAAHVRLAYVCLCESPVESAVDRMRTALCAFLAHVGADPAKYHETLTRAWILAVAHFMDGAAPCGSAAAFVDQNPRLLDTGIMLTHYSADRLVSAQAREDFVEPDVSPIPGL